MAVGVVLIGILAWPLAEPDDPFGAVSVAAGTVTLGDAITLALLAFLAGILGYIVSWPYGPQIGVLAAPAGLAVWALRTGSMASLMTQNPALEQRVALFSGLQWESLFWLSAVAAGFAGVLFSHAIWPPQAEPLAEETKRRQNQWKPGPYVSAIIGPAIERKVVALRNRMAQRTSAGQRSEASTAIICLNAALAVVSAGLIILVCIGLLAQDVATRIRAGGPVVVGQPAVAQIAFAVFVSFEAGAFVVKKVLNAGYIWAVAASVFITFYTISTYGRAERLTYLMEWCPPIFFSNSAVAILPVQMVAFGTLGAITGYWMGVRYSFSQKHE
jgi:hypothetical protein